MAAGELAGETRTIAGFIRAIPDYPKPGVVFRDLTPLFGDGPAFASTVDLLVQRFAGLDIDQIGRAHV